MVVGQYSYGQPLKFDTGYFNPLIRAYAWRIQTDAPPTEEVLGVRSARQIRFRRR